MRRKFVPAIAATAALIGAPACSEPPANCPAEETAAQISAVVGAVQTDGTVTVYGTVQFQGTSDLAVRAIYVAGVEVPATAGGFNFRTWSVAIPQDRLVATAGGTDHAALPVIAYLYGGCTVQLPASAEPVVHGIVTDAGAPGNGAPDGAVDAGDGEGGVEIGDGGSDAGDASDASGD